MTELTILLKQAKEALSQQDYKRVDSLIDSAICMSTTDDGKIDPDEKELLKEIATKPEMMICPLHKSCKADGCYHYKSHKDIGTCYSVLNCPKCVPVGV